MQYPRILHDFSVNLFSGFENKTQLTRHSLKLYENFNRNIYRYERLFGKLHCCCKYVACVFNVAVLFILATHYCLKCEINVNVLAKLTIEQYCECFHTICANEQRFLFMCSRGLIFYPKFWLMCRSLVILKYLAISFNSNCYFFYFFPAEFDLEFVANIRITLNFACFCSFFLNFSQLGRYKWIKSTWMHRHGDNYFILKAFLYWIRLYREILYWIYRIPCIR